MKFEKDPKHLSLAIYLALSGIAVVSFYLIVSHFTVVKNTLGFVNDLLMPFTIAFVLAYLMNPLMACLENKVFSRIKKSSKKIFRKEESSTKPPRAVKRQKKLERSYALVLTYVIVTTLTATFFSLVLPELANSLLGLIENFSGYVDSTQEMVDGLIDWLLIHVPYNEASIEQFVKPAGDLLTLLTEYMTTLLPHIYDSVVRFTLNFINVFLGIIISVYILFNKESLMGQCKKILYALSPKEKANEIVFWTRKTHTTFGGFINGKILDSFIIGILCFIGMMLLNIPYAVLVSCIVGLTNVIPYFGPFIGAIPSAIIILFVSPVKALIFCIFILALQQFDGNILGPKILGPNIGLTSFWVIFGIIVFGGLLGPLGLFIGVPVFAMFYALLKHYLEKRLKEKGLPTDTGYFTNRDIE